jgi:hypothetical protein
VKIVLLLAVSGLLLTGCVQAMPTNSWSMSASTSCAGLISINCGNVTQTMPQPDANNILLAATLLAVASLLLVALALGGAL